MRLIRDSASLESPSITRSPLNVRSRFGLRPASNAIAIRPGQIRPKSLQSSDHSELCASVVAQIVPTALVAVARVVFSPAILRSRAQRLRVAEARRRSRGSDLCAVTGADRPISYGPGQDCGTGPRERQEQFARTRLIAGQPSMIGGEKTSNVCSSASIASNRAISTCACCSPSSATSAGAESNSSMSDPSNWKA